MIIRVRNEYRLLTIRQGDMEAMGHQEKGPHLPLIRGLTFRSFD